MQATFFCFVLLSFVLSVLSDAPSGFKTLVLVDTFEVRYTHSYFLQNLQDRGYQLTFALADDPELSLSEHGEFKYDNIIIFAPGVEEFGGTVTSSTFVEFIDRGGNLLVATDSSIGDPIREIASECELSLMRMEHMSSITLITMFPMSLEIIHSLFPTEFLRLQSLPEMPKERLYSEELVLSLTQKTHCWFQF